MTKHVVPVCFKETSCDPEDGVNVDITDKTDLCLPVLSARLNFIQAFEYEHKVTLTHIRHSETHCAWIDLLFG